MEAGESVPGEGGASNEIGMRAEQGDLPLVGRAVEDVAEGVVEIIEGVKRAVAPRIFDDPRRALEEAGERGDEGVAGERR